MRAVHIGDTGTSTNPLTKGGIDKCIELGEVLTPQWAKIAQTDDDGRIITFEIPIITQGESTQAIVAENNSNRAPTAYRSNKICKLIIKRDVEQEKTFYFVATLIPDSLCIEKKKLNQNSYRFMKDPTYSGLVILSTVKGEYFSAFMHKNGQRRRVKLRRITNENQISNDNQVLARLNFSEPPSARMLRIDDSEGSVDMTYTCSTCGAVYPYMTICGTCYPIEVEPDPTDPPTQCTNPDCPYNGACGGACTSSGGGGGDIGGGDIGGGGGSGSSPIGGGITKERMKAAVTSAIQTVITLFPDSTRPACSHGVRAVFQTLFKSKELDGMLANDMVTHWNSKSTWVKIPMGSAQNFANYGFFVVAGRFEPTPNESGHVVVVVPGKEQIGWGGLSIPIVMDTGYKMRSKEQKLSRSWRIDFKNEIQFFYYKP